MLRMGADVAVADEELGEGVEVLGDGFEYFVEVGDVEGLVKIVPVDGAGRNFIFDDIPVFWAAAGEGASLYHEGPGVVEDALFAAEGVTDEFMWWKLVVEGVGNLQAQADEMVRGDDKNRH